MLWRKIGINSGYLTIATISLAGLQLAIIILIARVDGPLLVGQYALAQAYAVPAYFFASLSIRQQYFVLQSDNVSLADFLFLRLVFPALVFASLLVIICFSYNFLSFCWLATGVFAMKYIEGIFELASGKMQRVGDVRGVATTTLIRTVVSVPAFGTLYFATRNLPLALGALSALFIVFFFIQRKRFNLDARPSDVFDLRSQRLKRRIAIAYHLFPFGVTLIVGSLGLYAPRFLLDEILGPRELGLFVAVSHLLAVGGIAASSLGQALLPSLADEVSKHSVREFWHVLFWASALVQCACLIGVLIAMAIGSQLLILFYGPEFGGQGHTLVVATIAAGPIYCASIVMNGCYAAKMRRGLLAIECLSLFVVILATHILVRPFGIDGAFGGMMISAITRIVVSSAFLCRLFYNRKMSARKEVESDESDESVVIQGRRPDLRSAADVDDRKPP